MATNECEYGNERGKTTGGKKEMGMIDGKQDSQFWQEVTNFDIQSIFNKF